jgi:hypothetical protein
MIGATVCLASLSHVAYAAVAPTAFDAPGPDTLDQTSNEIHVSSDDHPPPLDREKANQSLERLLDKHRFCSRGDYRIPFDERALCALSKQAKARCPGIEKACKNPFLEEQDGWNLSLDWLDFPELLLVFRLFLWGLFIGAAIFLAVALLRRFIRVPAADEPEADDKVSDEFEPAVVSAATPLETDVERLLARAREAGERGDFSAGIRDAYAALLRHLDGKGLIEIHRSKTNGDYRRSLGHEPRLQTEFASVARVVEGVQFGSREASSHTFRTILDRVVPLVSGSARALLLLLAAFYNTACQELTERPTASALGCGETPGGYSVLCELLLEHASTVRRRIRKVDDIEPEIGQLVILDDAELSDEEWKYIEGWVERGHTLVLSQVPSPLATNVGVKRAPKRCSKGSFLPDSLKDYYGHATKLATLIESPLQVKANDSWVLAQCEAGPTLLGVAHGSGTVFLLPSSQLLTNISLASGDNALLVAKWFARPDQGSEIIGNWTGAGSTNPLEALANARLTPWLLQLLLLAMLLAWHKGPRFGLPRDPTSNKRHAFVEHIEALGLKYARSKASRHALANYESYALARLHDRLLPGSRASIAELATALSKLTGRDETAVLQILIAARSAQDEAHDTATPEEHLNTMRDLESLLRTAGGNR